MAAAQELDPAELARVVELLHEQVLAAVDDGLHHHVDLAALALRARRSGGTRRPSSPPGTVLATCLPAFSAAIDCGA